MVSRRRTSHDFGDGPCVEIGGHVARPARRIARVPCSAYFSSRSSSNSARLRRVPGEESCSSVLTRCARSSSRAQRRIERQMAQQIETGRRRVVRLFGQRIEINPSFLQRCDDFGSLNWVSPLLSERRRVQYRSSARYRREYQSYLTTRSCFPFGVEFIDQMRRNLHLPAVEIILSALFRRRIDDLRIAGMHVSRSVRLRSVSDDGLHFALPYSSISSSVMRTGSPSNAGSAKLPSGRARIIDDVEPEFAVVVPDSGAAPDDLLELGHRVHHAREHDILARRCVEACLSS